MDTTFRLEPSQMNPGDYALKINLLGSEKSIEFFQDPKTRPVPGKTVDLHSQNGDVTQKDKETLEKATMLAEKLNHTSDQTLLVLDLKGSGGKYLDNEELITRNEATVLQQFKADYPVLNFIILEGSLKIDILRSGIFTSEEIKYLQEDSKGKVDLCQIAEFFMMAFKFGQSATCNKTNFVFQKYIHPIGNDKPFQPRMENVIFFPSLYKDACALEGKLASCYRSVFNVAGKFHKQVSKITTWVVTPLQIEGKK